MLRPAAEFFSKNYLVDKAMPILNRLLDPSFKASSEPLQAWARRKMASCLASSIDPAVRSKSTEPIAVNRAKNPNSLEDLRVEAILTSTQPGKSDKTIQLFLDLEKRGGLGPKEEILLIDQLDRKGEQEQAETRIQRLCSSESCEPVVLAFATEALDQSPTS